MTKQKHGFLVFICSLIPGAGEMYMGFKKQGISIMVLFWGIIAIAGGLNIQFLTAVLPIVWFYSFFNVHNLKSLTEDEFYSVEDGYLFHLQNEKGMWIDMVRTYKIPIAVVLILLGVLTLWNCVPYIFGSILPTFMYDIFHVVGDIIPRTFIGVAIIIGGIYLLLGHGQHNNPSNWS